LRLEFVAFCTAQQIQALSSTTCVARACCRNPCKVWSTRRVRS